MPTPVYLTGFENGYNPTTNGLGLWNSVNGSPVVDSSIKRTGGYSLKVSSTGTGGHNCRKNIGASVQTAVSTFHFYVPTGGIPSANTIVCGFTFATATGTAGLHLTTAGLVRAQVGNGTTVGSTQLVLDQWHRIDFRLNITATTWVLEWYLDGVQQPNAQQTGQTTTDTIAGFRFGSSSTSAIYTIYFDDFAVSETSADYPIGDIAVELLRPSSDGTHNPGTNIIEDQAGNDIGLTTAYNKINSVPTNSTEYIKQVTAGASNYAEVLFENIVASHSTIHGAMAILAYSSETTTSNRGACIISKDNFATNTQLWGAPGATADYSDGSISTPYWKAAMVSGVVDTATVNSLSARLGYSDDATPNPYWLDLMVEVGYVPSSDISLELVTYSSVIRDITLTENVVVPLDLVTYSSTVRDITVLENVVIQFDRVSYSSTIREIVVVENTVIPLDLVAFSSAIRDLTILENVTLPLGVVTFSSVIHEIDLLEEGSISLELVTYTSLVRDITVLENVVVPLDLVSYSSTINEIQLLMLDDILFELVTYSVVINDILFVSPEIVTNVPFERMYSIERDIRLIDIEGRVNVVAISKENRIFSVIN